MVNAIEYWVHAIKSARAWRIFLRFSVFYFVILLLACNPDSGNVSVLDTPLPSLSMSTETPQPTLEPTKTITASRQATWTPVSTLPVEIGKQNLIELFSTNGGCEFPCWWGIRSGDPIQKVSELAPVLGKSLRPYGSFYYYTLSLDNLNTPDVDVNFHVNSDETVHRIEVSLIQPSRFRDYYDAFEAQFSLASLMSHYGAPNEVLFLVTPRFEPGETPRPYTLFLIYEMQDFGIVYSGLVDSENPLRVCSIELYDHRLQNVQLYFRDPRQKIVELNRFNSTQLQPLGKVASIGLDDFYRIYSESETDKCIEVLVDVWQ